MGCDPASVGSWGGGGPKHRVTWVGLGGGRSLQERAQGPSAEVLDLKAVDTGSRLYLNQGTYLQVSS